MMNNTLTKIYVVRHGQSEANVLDTIPDEKLETWGEFQAPLTEKGKAEARDIAEHLRKVHFDGIFSSDLNRARQTAEYIADGRDMLVTTVSTIRERNYGKGFEKYDKYERERLKVAMHDLNDEEKFAYKYLADGESAKDAVGRFVAFLHEIIPIYSGKTILVVNHGAVMRAFLTHIGWGTYSELPSGAIKNTGYFVLETDGKTFTIEETWKITKAR
jgi:broad specificity phosphatase PhoE